jgi:hypothetical protein
MRGADMNTARNKSIRIIALVSTVLVALLFAAAIAGIGMAQANRLGTPRITTETIGGWLMPIPALAWIAFLWSGECPHTTRRWIRRTLGTLALLSIGFLGFIWATVLASVAG